MTKVLSFSATEILPALLSRQKQQTIRSAWKEVRIGNDRVYSAANGKIKLEDKPARFKVGEKVNVAWRSRGTPKQAWFCSFCGERVIVKNSYRFSPCPTSDRIETVFPKVLGTATITEVFQIEMWRENALFAVRKKTLLREPTYIGNNRINVALSKKDGFKSEKEMFAWFDSKYSLTEPKRFWVYRWKWLQMIGRKIGRLEK